jgi:hypothetical protein
MIQEHPVFGKRSQVEWVTLYFEGRKYKVESHLSIAAALMSQGIKTLGYSRKLKESRGYFCGVGRCSNCYMCVDDERNVRTCMKRVEDEMTIHRDGSR